MVCPCFYVIISVTVSTCHPPAVLDDWQVTVCSCSYHLSMAQSSHRNWSTYGGMASFYRRWSSRGEEFPLNLKTMSLSGYQTTSSQSKCKPSGDVQLLKWVSPIWILWHGCKKWVHFTFFFFSLVYILQWQNLVQRAFHLFGLSVWSVYWEKKNKKSGYNYV